MEEASVAGESPDRSKQRESSAEPTPGSGGPVPEARDPRLAVSRRTADTATRVLSVRDVPTTAGGPEQEAEDSRLRAAVATWVRTGDSAQGDAETAGGDEEVRAGSEPADDGSQAQTDSEAKAGDAAAGSEAEDEAQADSGGEDDESAAAQADTEAKGEDESAADSEPADNEAATQGDSEPDDDRSATQSGSEPEDDRSAVQASSEAKDGETATGSETDTEARADTDGEDDQNAAQADTEPDDDKATAAAQSDTEPEDDRSAVQASSEAKDGETATGSETDTEARADTDGEDDQSAAQADSEPEDDEAAAAQADSVEAEAPEAGAGSEGDGGDEDERDGADDAAVKAADAATASEPKADADAKGSTPKSTPDPRTPRDPRAADGEDAPKGPPATDDESRTGGAGGKDTAEGEAEADAKPADAPKSPKGPVDHPTAVFKAPKPKPQVDQPTTMLKLGGAPKPKPTEPADAERTSKFVALKPLDDPAARKPKPPAQAPAPADVTTAIPQVGPERTTQQPLPPKPPLDLLAELTNTPPPPETPVRTIVRRVKIWTPLVILLVIIFAVVQAVRPLPTPTLALTAEESYQFDGGKVSLPWPSEGQGWMDGEGIGTMDSFGKQKPVPIASVTKTMTAYIVLKDHPLKPGEEGPEITVDATAEKEGGYDKDDESTLNSVKAGDKLTLKQALSAVMIPSANNIARLLARWDAGSEAAFVKKMNATAKALGMTNTTYTDPSGLKETTVSTAQDQVKLGNEVVKIPALVAITSAASWTDPHGKYHRNYNDLPYKMGAIGIKTGSTTKAGGNLLFAARKKVGGETVTVVGAIFGQYKPGILDTVNAVSQTALTAAKDALTAQKIMKKGDVVGYVDDGLGGHTPVVVTEDVTAVGWAGLKVKLSFVSNTVPHTAKAGTKVGTLTVGDGKSGAVQVPVALKKDLTEPGFPSKLTRLG
ncbi:D-alanyl-D-alanine carboxypeptidase [Streptomyces sp. NPDC001177]